MQDFVHQQYYKGFREVLQGFWVDVIHQTKFSCLQIKSSLSLGLGLWGNLNARME